MGTEDAVGAMDFKVAGTRQGVTSIQMDIKILGLDFKIIAEALEKAKQARLHILDIMDQVMPKPRSQLSKYAPRIITIQIRPDKIGDLIGPKGKTIRGIQEQTGAEINVDDNGMVTISAVGEGGERARDMVQALVQEPEVGKVYEGVVKSTTAFGAFVEIIPGVEGLLHISELQHGRTERTEDVVKKGDHVRVKLLEVDERGRMRLSRKALLEKPEPARSHGWRRSGSTGRFSRPPRRAASSSCRSGWRASARRRWVSGYGAPAPTSPAPRWASRTCSSTWSSRAPSGGRRSRSPWRSSPGADRSTRTRPGIPPLSRPASWTPISRKRSTCSPIWSETRYSGQATSSSSGTSSSRRSTPSKIPRTTRCSISLTRPSGPSIRTATPFSARATPSAPSRRTI